MRRGVHLNMSGEKDSGPRNHEEKIKDLLGRKNKTAVKKDDKDGLSVSYTKEELQRFLPHLSEEMAVGVSDAPVSIKGVRQKPTKEDLKFEEKSSPISGKVLTEEEYLADYNREQDKENALMKESTPIEVVDREEESEDEDMGKLVVGKVHEPALPDEDEEGDEDEDHLKPSEIFKTLQVDPFEKKHWDPRTKAELIALSKEPSPFQNKFNQELFNPNEISFLRRCKTDDQAHEIINYLEKQGEITSKRAAELRKMLDKDGVRVFGSLKRPGYYERAYPRMQKEMKVPDKKIKKHDEEFYD